MDWIVPFIIVANLVIVAGYLFIAKEIAPHLGVTKKQTIYGGVAFFVLCAATHAEEALHAFSEENYWTVNHALGMLVISVLQAFAVWVFIFGLYREFVLPGRPLKARGKGR